MSTILVVEDSACIRKLVTASLTKEGYRVIAASDGTSALSHIHDKTCCAGIDMMILDLNLPDMSGEQIIRELSQDERARNIPVAMMTCEELDKPIQHDNVVATISKPFQIRSFLDIVYSVLEAQNEKTACPCYR